MAIKMGGNLAVGLYFECDVGGEAGQSVADATGRPVFLREARKADALSIQVCG